MSSCLLAKLSNFCQLLLPMPFLTTFGSIWQLLATFVILLYCPLVILSSRHSVLFSSCQSGSLSICQLVNFLACELLSLWTFQFVHLGACEPPQWWGWSPWGASSWSRGRQWSRGEEEVEEEGREQLEDRGGKAKTSESTHLSLFCFWTTFTFLGPFESG